VIERGDGRGGFCRNQIAEDVWHSICRGAGACASPAILLDKEPQVVRNMKAVRVPVFRYCHCLFLFMKQEINGGVKCLN
jgi:hypothetical protein